MNIIITGGLGHIGSRLLQDLPKILKINKILIIDNLITQRYFSLFDLKNAKFKFLNLDLSKKESINQILKIKTKYDCVIHLAAMTNAEYSLQNPMQYKNNNFNATKNIVSLCMKKNIPLFHASTTSVYGTQKNIIDENCSKKELKPQSPYAETKLKEEDFLLNLVDKKKLRCNIFRFGTVCGVSKGMRFHTAINKFCYQASLNIPLTIWKTALNQKRPYLDLMDLVNVLSYFIKNKIYQNKIYNVVTANLTVKDITNMILKSKKIKIDYVESKIMNQLSYEVKNTNLSNFDFKFKGNIDKSIKETLKLFANINNN